MKLPTTVIALVALAQAAVAGGEAALAVNESVAIRNKTGTLTVKAGPDLKRDYTWNGQTRSLIMWARKEPWMGSDGLYYPGPGEHWKDHEGIRRAVVEEGIRRFKTPAEFSTWIKHEYQAYLDYRFLDQGRIGGWVLVKERRQLNACVWKILIDGKALTRAQWEQAVKATP